MATFLLLLSRSHCTFSESGLIRFLIRQSSVEDDICDEHRTSEPSVKESRKQEPISSIRLTKFDPKKAKSANILAGGAAGAIGLNALRGGDE